MIVFTHVVIALLSVALASFAFFKPSKGGFRATYAFIVATLGSGLYLVWLMPSKMLHVCISGITYTVVISALTILAQLRFAKLQKSEQK